MVKFLALTANGGIYFRSRIVPSHLRGKKSVWQQESHRVCRDGNRLFQIVAGNWLCDHSAVCRGYRETIGSQFAASWEHEWVNDLSYWRPISLCGWDTAIFLGGCLDLGIAKSGKQILLNESFAFSPSHSKVSRSRQCWNQLVQSQLGWSWR